MLSDRELERLRHDLERNSDLTYLSVETSVLRELLDFYEQNHTIAQKPVKTPPAPPPRARNTDD